MSKDREQNDMEIKLVEQVARNVETLRRIEQDINHIRIDNAELKKMFVEVQRQLVGGYNGKRQKGLIERVENIEKSVYSMDKSRALSSKEKWSELSWHKKLAVLSLIVAFFGNNVWATIMTLYKILEPLLKILANIPK